MWERLCHDVHVAATSRFSRRRMWKRVYALGRLVQHCCWRQLLKIGIDFVISEWAVYSLLFRSLLFFFSERKHWANDTITTRAKKPAGRMRGRRKPDTNNDRTKKKRKGRKRTASCNYTIRDARLFLFPQAGRNVLQIFSIYYCPSRNNMARSTVFLSYSTAANLKL